MEVSTSRPSLSNDRQLWNSAHFRMFIEIFVPHRPFPQGPLNLKPTIRGQNPHSIRKEDEKISLCWEGESFCWRWRSQPHFALDSAQHFAANSSLISHVPAFCLFAFVSYQRAYLIGLRRRMRSCQNWWEAGIYIL